MEIRLLLSTLISLFVVADPVGTSSVFAALTRNIPEGEQRRIAIRAATTSAVLLILFVFAGKALLHYMHVSLPAFRVAGGLLLFITAFRMIMGFHDPNQLNSEKSAYLDHSNIAIFPLSIPLLAGPGVMTAALFFWIDAKTIPEYSIVIFSIITIQAIALLCMWGAGKLSHVFGSSGIGIIARIMGVLLAAMAVQFIADGVKALMQVSV